MVRRGSTVRVRQRALQNCRTRGFFLRLYLQILQRAAGMEPSGRERRSFRDENGTNAFPARGAELSSPRAVIQMLSRSGAGHTPYDNRRFGPRRQAPESDHNDSPFIVVLPRFTNAMIALTDCGTYATCFTRRTAGARWAGRPGSLRPSSRLASQPGQAQCPGRRRGTAACPGRGRRGR